MHAHLIVSGRVQGVGFRFTTQQKAIENNLTGWVKNKSDGTVELEVEGDEDQINSFIDELKKGFHQFIKIDHVELTMSQKRIGYKKFSIKH